ncbi:hypothetical protein DFH06DRAFT_1251316 [Mycena polygramma]|nr:hypothetical protein DFH06DRAFT_1251316 [Mycena polygramma]
MKVTHKDSNEKITTLAESDKTIVVEGNHYFPPESLTAEFKEHRTDSTTSTKCDWKGDASYYNYVPVGANAVNDIAW